MHVQERNVFEVVLRAVVDDPAMHDDEADGDDRSKAFNVLGDEVG